MKEINNTRIMFGAYLPDNDSHSLYNEGMTFIAKKSLHKYIPVWETMTCNFSTEVTFTDGNNKFNEILGYNATASNKKLTDAAIRKGRINLTHNDLSLGVQRHVFNFSGRSITTVDRDGLRKTFSAISNEKLEEYNGSVLIFETIALNTPSFIKSETGRDDYIHAIQEQMELNGTKLDNKTLRMYRFADEMYKEAMLDRRVYRGNTVKVVGVIALFPSDVALLSSDDLYLKEIELVISAKDVFHAPENPVFSLGGMTTSDYQSIVNLSGVNLFINDYNNTLGDRFTYMAGEAVKIATVKKRELSEGLYRTNINEGTIRNEYICSLEEIAEKNFIYRTQEEALRGADISAIRSDQLVMDKLELENLKLENQKALLAQQLENDRIIKNLNLQLEEYKKNSTISQLQAKNQRELDSNEHAVKRNESDTYKELFKVISDNHKAQMELSSLNRKHEYEQGKYDRDRTLETIKTIAAVAGVVATGYTIYKKLS